MANKTITDLTETTTLSDSDYLVVQQPDGTKKVKKQNIGFSAEKKLTKAVDSTMTEAASSATFTFPNTKHAYVFVLVPANTSAGSLRIVCKRDSTTIKAQTVSNGIYTSAHGVQSEIKTQELTNGRTIVFMVTRFPTADLGGSEHAYHGWAETAIPRINSVVIESTTPGVQLPAGTSVQIYTEEM